MNINELTENDKNMNFKPLNINKDVQDSVMEGFGFKDPGQMFECGVLALRTFLEAKNQGCDMMLFERTNNNGNKEYMNFDYMKIIEYIKSNPNPENAHDVKFNKY